MARVQKIRRGTPKPICLTCKVNRVRAHHNKYCSPACVPRSVRVENCRRGRKTFAYRRRAMAFRADLERLGRTPTREDLVALLHTVYRRGYNAGFQVGCRAAKEGDTQSLRLARERGAA